MITVGCRPCLFSRFCLTSPAVWNHRCWFTLMEMRGGITATRSGTSPRMHVTGSHSLTFTHGKQSLILIVCSPGAQQNINMILSLSLSLSHPPLLLLLCHLWVLLNHGSWSESKSCDWWAWGTSCSRLGDEYLPGAPGRNPSNLHCCSSKELLTHRHFFWHY